MLMHGTPPAEEGQVTLANWLDSPFNRWSFWHVRELLPTHRVSRGDGPVRAITATDREVPHLQSLPITRADGSAGTVGEVVADTFTDALVVLHDGHLVSEWYGSNGASDRTHLLMSVTKSVVGCVAAVLVDQGRLDPDLEISAYVPELADGGYAGATVRNLLDMRSGVGFREEYTNPEAEVRILDQWTGWRPSGNGEAPRGLYRFLATLGADTPHGGSFVYRSADTDVLGWVCERAGGARMADLMSDLVWAPMGAERDAELICDGVGTGIHDGGLNATARDLARFGQMVLDGGTVPDPSAGPGGVRTVLPADWMHAAWAVDSDVREAFAASPSEQAFPGGWYRNKFWFRPGEHGDVLLCLGIHGQMVHVNRHTRTVCVKLSTWPEAQDPAALSDTVRAFDAVGGALKGNGNGGERPHVSGVATGQKRRGVTSTPWSTTSAAPPTP